MLSRDLIRSLGAVLALAIPAIAQPLDRAGNKGLPLAPARHMELTTNEGTWISLDVSPDGKAIILYLLNNRGG
jgi:hypothetical protein